MDVYDSAQGRRSAILQRLNKDSSVNVTELSKEFGVSEVTIRKDLRILRERKLLIRVHGGAISRSNVYADEEEDRHFSFKSLVNSREKEAIGRAAAAHIKNGDTIIIDSGSTALEVAKNLHKFQDLTIITNSVNAMIEALKYKRFKVILLGGTVRESSYSTVGPLAESNLKVFRRDRSFDSECGRSQHQPGDDLKGERGHRGLRQLQAQQAGLRFHSYPGQDQYGGYGQPSAGRSAQPAKSDENRGRNSLSIETKPAETFLDVS